MGEKLINLIKNNKRYIISITAIFFLGILYINKGHILNFISILRDREALKLYLNSFGVFGKIIFILLHVTQVVIFFIPGEILQAAGGYVYGTFWGSFLCFVGIALGSLVAFYVSKKYGRPFVTNLICKNHMNKLEKLLNCKKINLMVFLLFLIPAIPKDSLILICGLSKIKVKEFIFFSMLGRIPALVVSNFWGHSMAIGNRSMLLGASLVILVIIIFCAIKKEMLLKKLSEI